ncbi:MAG: hypothetical protein WCT14_00945 [Treponemataceae bacterium]
MGAPSIFAVLSTLPDSQYQPVIETLVAQAASDANTHPVIIAPEDRPLVRSASGKVSKDDPLLRYGHAAFGSSYPVLTRGEAAVLFRDRKKGRNAELIDDRTFLFLTDSIPQAETLNAFDAFCFIITGDRSAIPFMYEWTQTVIHAKGNASFRFLFVNEMKLEKAAEFFIELKAELNPTRNDSVEYVFCGSLAIRSEELALAESAGMLIPEAFPRGTTHGQARYAATRLFARSSVETSDAAAERVRLFSTLLD